MNEFEFTLLSKLYFYPPSSFYSYLHLTTDLSTLTQFESSPLHMAAEKGHIHVVTYLKEQGFDLEAVDKVKGIELISNVSLSFIAVLIGFEGIRAE